MKRVLGGKREAPNAERDCQRKFQRMGFSLPITIQTVKHEIDRSVITTNWVKVSHWLDYLLKRMPVLLGSPSASLESQCKTFWTLFQHDEPDHVIYQSGKNLSRCLPILLYGDEGRGPKRALFLEMAFETPFGVFDYKSHNCECASALRGLPASAVPDCNACIFNSESSPVGKLSTTLKAHSYLTKHLIFGMPSYLYKAYPNLLLEHLRLLAEDMQGLFERGITIGDDQWYAILIGVKGDMKFHAETVGQFDRCYSNLGRKQKLHMCPLCLAGDPAFPFEEVDHQPAWSSSLFASRPWTENEAPDLVSIPFDRFGRQEGMFRLDLFHVLKVGLSRDVIGSLTVIYCRLGLFDYDTSESKDFGDRLERAHGSFRLWCMEHHKSPGLRSFTKNFMNCKTFAATPWSNSKGSDSTLLLKWLLWFSGLQLATDPGELDAFLRAAKTILRSILGIHQLCESHGLFLPRKCGQMLYVRMMTTAKAYHLLAKFALDFQMVGFGVKPKYHALKHLAWKVRAALLSGAPWVLNPNMHSCESNEDHVGKVSSLARKVSTRTIGYRVIQRYFLKSRALFVRHQQKYGKGCLR